MSEDEESSIAEKIPIEIIPNILQHLSTFDRKNAKLVNSKWYQASRGIIFHKKQKFVLDGLIYKNQLTAIFDVLNGAGHQYYNMEFRNEDFHKSLNEFVTFIKSNSMYIFSLKFLACSLPFAMLEEIMINCEQLEELIFKKCSFTDSEKVNLIGDSEKKIVQKNLSFVELNKSGWLDNVFATFLDVYPNLKKYRYSMYKKKFTVYFSDYIAERSKPLFLHSVLVSCLHDCVFFHTLAGCPWIRLKELWLHDDYFSFGHNHLNAWHQDYHNRSNIEESLQTHTDLKSFNFRHCERFRLDSLDAIVNLFPNLERLNVSVDRRGHGLTKPEKRKMLEVLLGSKLKVLEIGKLDLFTKMNTFPQVDRNRNLYHLDLHGDGKGGDKSINDVFLITMLKTFCDLTYLDLSDVQVRGTKKDVVKIIFHDQIKLKYLKLNYCPWVSDRAFEGNNVPGLKHLELARTRVTESAISQFNFPKLKFLRLKGCTSLSEKGMVLIPTKCPILQYLDVSDTRISENTAIEIFKNLKFLHCINIAKRKKQPIILNNENVTQLCPSLRFIEMGKRVPHIEEGEYSWSARKGDIYVYNYMEKSWNKCDKNHPRCSKCLASRRALMKLNY